MFSITVVQVYPLCAFALLSSYLNSLYQVTDIIKFASRQHWFIARLGGASVTAGGFTPRNSNVLIISTSSNQVFAFDVEAKQLGEWSMKHTFSLPRRYQEFPGEVIGLSFPPSASTSSVVVYSPRYHTRNHFMVCYSLFSSLLRFI